MNISREEFVSALGVLAKNLSEEEIDKVWKVQDEMAELLWAMWLDGIINEKAECST